MSCDPALERNSRTLKEARRGQLETFSAIALSLVGVIGAIAAADRIVQIAVGGVAAAILLSAYLRFARVKHYRRQDHASGKNRKPGDVDASPDGAA
jgi:uncharacterized membrane protein YoaK (UPF0700 family)